MKKYKTSKNCSSPIEIILHGDMKNTKESPLRW